ncbi:unnamed protein product [Prunus armeniaca]
MRSYQLTCTGSHQNSEVKRVWARVVLGWKIPGLTTEFKWGNDKVLRKRNFALVNDVGCPRKAVGHRNAMSCTRGAVPFKSTVHGPNSEAEPQICDSPDLPLHALLLNCFRLLSYATPRSSPPINWAPERNENENAAGPTHCRNYWDFFFFFLLGSIIAR